MDPTDDQIEKMADEAHRLAMDLTSGGGAPPLRRFIFTMRYHNYKPFLVAELNYHYGLSEGLFMGVFMEQFDRMPTGREVDLMRRRADSYQAEVAESVEERTHARLSRNDGMWSPTPPGQTTDAPAPADQLSRNDGMWSPAPHC